VIVTQVEIVFWLFAVSSIVSAAICITRKSPVASALWLVGTMFSLAAIFLLLDAQFIAAIQILVYAGAIMVLFLFVIMLLNLGRSGPQDMLGWVGRLVMLAVAGLLGVELWVLARAAPSDQLVLTGESVADLATEHGAVGMMSEPLFHGFLLPFEITGILLLAAIVGAVVLAKRRI
jgi:NADH-quinone oxidoreductase subunit J